MPMDPRMLAAVMQRMQPQATPPGVNAPVPPAPPPPGTMAASQSPGMPVQMQGTMMMKPAQPPSQAMAPGAGPTAPMPPRQF